MKEVKRNKIMANIHNFFCCCYCLIKNGFTRVSGKIKLLINKTSNYGYVGLGPTDDAENASEYLRALEWAIKNRAVTNIAVAGPYGAGKSSVINTFMKKHPRIKYINISLAAFREKHQEKIDPTEEDFEKLLEEGILKQLFYKVHYTKIPQSRYRKLHKVSFGTSFLRVLFTLALIVSFAFLFAPIKIEEVASAYSDTMSKLLGWNELQQILFAGGFGIVIIIIMTSLFRWVNTKWKSIEINVADKAIIKANEVGEALSLNKNMDEILYFFEETDYTIVVIEDLDRFDTPEVFTKLREINKIINDYDAISRRVVFLYALKDDIFHNEDRTKFFDFIIPVVPYIDATNSGEYLKQRLDALKATGLEFSISDQFIMNIAPYISDMRVLNNICNEFVVFKKTIKDNQELDKLQDVQMLSIMIFKNMYPNEFSEIQKAGGVIKKAYNDRGEFIKKNSSRLQEEIETAEAQKKASDSQGVLDAEGVKLAFIQKLTGEKGVFTKLQAPNGKTYTKKEILAEDFRLSQIGNGNVTIYYYPINTRNGYNYNQESADSRSSIENLTCSDGITYYRKCDRAIDRDKKHRKQIAQNLIDKQTELYIFRSQTMKSLIKEYGVDAVLSEEVRENKLLTFMLRHGYIDDTYQMYINYFLPGSITADELNFIINVRNFAGNSDWDYRIIHPANVVNRLFDYEFEQQRECLNFNLADFFYSDDKSLDKKTGFTKQLAKDEDISRRFIKEYFVRAKNRAEFIKAITQQKPLFWYDICSDEGLGYQDKVAYLIDIFMFLDARDIVLQDTAACEEDPLNSIGLFIVEHDEILELLQEAGAEKVVRALAEMKVKFKNINLNTVDKEIIKGIYRNELFMISLNMLQKYADFTAGKNIVEFSTNIFTYILEQGDSAVIDYLEENIREFVETVILETERDTKESIDTVKKCIRLLDYDETVSVQLIKKMEVIMDDLRSWLDSLSDQRKDVRKLVDAFFAENKIVASIANLDTYKGKYQFSSVLCSFVDDNIEALLSDEKMDDAHAKELLKKDIKSGTIETILQLYAIESFNESLNSYRGNVVEVMIKLKYFKYSRTRYNEISSTFLSLLPMFAEHYWEEFSVEIPNITFDITVLNEFIKSNLSDEKKLVFLGKAETSQMTEEMFAMVVETSVSVPKKYVKATWDHLQIEDRPEFMVKYFESFSIIEIQSMFAQMPDEYHAMKQEDGWHEVLLTNNKVNEELLNKLKIVGYISSIYTKEEKKSVFEAKAVKLAARVKAKR